MGIPAGVEHVVFGGGLPGGEVWQSGYWCEGNLPTTAAEATSEAELHLSMIEDTTSGPWYLSRTMYAPAITLDWCRVYVYPTGGPAATFVGDYSATVAGTGSAYPLPNQCSLVATLLTGLSGRANRGRMYLPAPSSGQGATGQASSGNCSNIANYWAAHFGELNTSTGTGNVVVVSAKGSGATHLVSQVRVDSRYDVQRRRANKQLVNSSSSSNVTQP